jgi:hypothetical protein
VDRRPSSRRLHLPCYSWNLDPLHIPFFFSNEQLTLFITHSECFWSNTKCPGLSYSSLEFYYLTCGSCILLALSDLSREYALEFSRKGKSRSIEKGNRCRGTSIRNIRGEVDAHFYRTFPSHVVVVKEIQPRKCRMLASPVGIKHAKKPFPYSTRQWDQ